MNIFDNQDIGLVVTGHGCRSIADGIWIPRLETSWRLWGLDE